MALALLAAAAAVFGCPADLDHRAETDRPAPPKGATGQVVAVSEDGADLRQKDGSTLHVAMTPGWTLSYARPGSAEHIRVGQFVGSANREVAAGQGQSTEVRVFEPGYVPEFGTHQLGAPGTPAGTAMTHGFVFATRHQAEAIQLEVHYPGGCRVLDIPGTVKVTDFVAVDRARATPGTSVSAVLRRDADGVMRAGRLTLDSAP